MIRIAVLDDWQDIARTVADWSSVAARAQVDFFTEAIGDEAAFAHRMAGYDILVAMRERTRFSGALLGMLPRLRMIALTGVFSGTIDFGACARQGIVVSHTRSTRSDATTSEMTMALLLAAARHVALGDRMARQGRFQSSVPMGTLLEGRTLGIVGLGQIGARVARLGQAFGMEVIAWSQNLTDEQAAVHRVRRVSKQTLFETADAVSLHLKLSDRTRHVVGAAELACMKPGAILVNTARGPLVDSAALMGMLESGRVRAGLDVYAEEPLPQGHPLTTCPNVVLSPHLGYCTEEVYGEFYRDSIENIHAFLDGAPIRVLNQGV